MSCCSISHPNCCMTWRAISTATMPVRLNSSAASPCPDHRADQLIRLLLAEAETPGPSSSLMAESLGRALTIHLLRFHSSLSGSPQVPTAHCPAPRMQRVIAQMRSRLDQEMKLSGLAAYAGLSPSQFVRSFREATGLPPHRYLRGLRIDKARELLEHTDLPVIDIALTCGFG